jgi:uncharacterized heparinase superfamily protein
MLELLPTRRGPWLHGDGGQLLIVPQDLRTADPSLASEIAAGQLGLAGAVATLDGRSPFDITPPSAAWREALESFEWLRDLRASGDPEARGFAQDAVESWIRRHAGRRDDGVIGTELAARRVLCWLAGSGYLLDDIEPQAYDRFVGALLHEVDGLARRIESTPEGLPRLLSRLAIVEADLCLSGRDGSIEQHLGELIRELDRQILPDGGHLSRDAGALIEIVLDLLPLERCLVARSMTPPDGLIAAIRRSFPMLRQMRLGDGMLSRFNGVGATRVDRLATVLSFEEGKPVELPPLTASRYGRIQRRQTVIVMDAGRPPPGTASLNSHAGCLSFEMSSGRALLIVNTGAPGTADAAWAINARGTAAHSTLTVNATSSGRLSRLKNRPGEPVRLLLEKPTHVEAKVQALEDGAIEIGASHNGYTDSYGLIHQRTLSLSAQGTRLDGIDRVYDPARPSHLRGGARLPFAVHFHLHPTAEATYGQQAGTCQIVLPTGEIWRFAGRGGEVGLEESVYLAHFAGPRQSVQIVIRGFIESEAEIRWRLERIEGGAGRSGARSED